MTWLEIEIQGDPCMPRAGGNMIYYKNEVLILGGWNDSGYINFDPMLIF